MKVFNFDANGNPIDDLSKVTLSLEDSAFIYQLYLESSKKE
ncbi:hypothetical protein [Enterococcus sp. AZ109]